MTAPLTAPIEAPTLPADDAVHIVCCNEDVAVCGAAVVGQGWLDDADAVDCPVCVIAEAELLPCGDPECWGADE